VQDIEFNRNKEQVLFSSNVYHQDSSLGLLLTFPDAGVLLIYITSAWQHSQILLKLFTKLTADRNGGSGSHFKLTDDSVLELHGMPFSWLKAFDYQLFCVKFNVKFTSTVWLSFLDKGVKHKISQNRLLKGFVLSFEVLNVLQMPLKSQYIMFLMYLVKYLVLIL